MIASTLPPTVAVDGAAIRSRRIARGVSLGNFAAAVDMPPQYLSHVERGVRARVPLPVFRRIVRALGLHSGRTIRVGTP